MAVTVIKTTDSMTTIQSKLTKYTNLQFQKGTYKITKQLIISANTTLDLNGSVLQRKGSLQSVFLNKVTKSTTKYSGAGNITVKNGVIEGMGGYSFDNLITFFHAKNVTITNVTFRDALCHAIELNSCSDATIQNCRFEGYNSEGSDYAYREVIQLDHAAASGFFLSGSTKSSACYDGTMCNNITIKDNIFTKSKYRSYPLACIGTHTQLYGGAQHSQLYIRNNEFHCRRTDLKQPCLSIIGMKDVYVENNKFDCERVARIYSKAESYATTGIKVTCKTGDGLNKNVFIRQNDISCSSTDAFMQYAKSGKNHSNIVKKPNAFNTPL